MNDIFKMNSVFLLIYISSSMASQMDGCYKTSYSDLRETMFGPITSSSFVECKVRCSKQGYIYAGETREKYCFCGNFEWHKSKKRPDSECNDECLKDSDIYCGLSMRIEIHELITGIEYPKIVKVSSSGRAAVLQSQRMKKYKLLPINKNNYPVWKMIGAIQYLFVAPDNYWSIGPNPSSKIVGLYLNKKDPTPLTPINSSSSWYIWDKNQAKGKEFQEDHGVYIEPVSDSHCKNDIFIGEYKEILKDTITTPTSETCFEECAKWHKECDFFVWEGPTSRRCWLKKINGQQFDEIPQKVLKGAVSGLRHCKIKTITSIVTGCTDRRLENWNYKDVSNKLTSWIKSLVTKGEKGSIQSKLYDRQTGEFLDHFAGFNDKPKELTEDEKKDEQNKEHITVITIGQFNDYDSDKWDKPVEGRTAWQWKSRNLMDGFLYGPVNSDGKFTGNNVTYLYPDMITGLRGEFVNGKMVEAREVRVVAERCVNGVKHLKMKLRSKRKHLVWEREETNTKYIGKYPKEADPYERRTSFIKESIIRSNIDGVFVKRKIMPGELVAYFSGTKTYVNHYWSANMTKAESEAAKAYVYAFGKYTKGYPNDMKIDIGLEHRSKIVYRTTIAHKVNHKFHNPSVRFENRIHPSFGDILSIVAKRLIEAGEEVFVHYNYHYTRGEAPRWWANEYYKAYGTQLKLDKNKTLI